MSDKHEPEHEHGFKKGDAVDLRGYEGVGEVVNTDNLDIMVMVRWPDGVLRWYAPRDLRKYPLASALEPRSS